MPAPRAGAHARPLKSPHCSRTLHESRKSRTRSNCFHATCCLTMPFGMPFGIGSKPSFGWHKRRGSEDLAMHGTCLALAFSSALLVPAVQLARAGETGFSRTFYERGLNQEAQGHYAEALADYSRAIKLDSKFVDAYFRRSSINAWNLPIEKRDYANAAADLKKILEFAPHDFSARFNRAVCYEQLRRYDDAIRDYSEAVVEDTNSSRAADKQSCLARAYHNRGRACQWYKRDNVKAVDDFWDRAAAPQLAR